MIELLRKELQVPSLELELRPAWASSQIDSRLKIRQGLGKRCQENFDNLNELPRPKDFNASVSHCAQTGGFALVAKPFTVGLDVEVISRVSASIAKRISAPGEFERAPSAACLWVAKESGYKSLAQEQQPTTFTQMQAFNWQKVQHSEPQVGFVWAFRLMNGDNPTAEKGRGLVLEDLSSAIPLAIALFCFQR